MKTKIELAVRLILGLMLAVFGANKFLHFMPMPDPPEAGGKFLGALMEAGYVFPFVGAVFLLVAVLLFLNRAVPFGLILLAPMTVNILLYHLKFDVAGIGAGVLLAILHVTLAFMHRDRFAPLFK